jgi:hypothetical protein
MRQLHGEAVARGQLGEGKIRHKKTKTARKHVLPGLKKTEQVDWAKL